MSGVTESEVEDAALEWPAWLGYAVAHGPDIGPGGPAPERGSHDEVLLARLLFPVERQGIAPRGRLPARS